MTLALTIAQHPLSDIDDQRAEPVSQGDLVARVAVLLDHRHRLRAKPRQRAKQSTTLASTNQGGKGVERVASLPIVSRVRVANEYGRPVVIKTQPKDGDIPAVRLTDYSYKFADPIEEVLDKRPERLVTRVVDLLIRLSNVITQISARDAKVDVPTPITRQTWICNHRTTPTELFKQSGPRLVWIAAGIAAAGISSLETSHLGSRPPLKKLTLRRSNSLFAARSAPAGEQFLSLDEVKPA